MKKEDKIKELRKLTGLNRREFCEKFQIPYRTVTEWEHGGRHAPDYVVRLLEYYILMSEGVEAEPVVPGRETSNPAAKDAPSLLHQTIVGMLFHAFMLYKSKAEYFFVPLMAPVRVLLDPEEGVEAQPDLLLVTERDQLKGELVYGAPAFVVEVLSEGTRKRDMSYNLFQYSDAGVKEYWIIDPQHKKVIVYDLLQGTPPEVYGFEDTVPVGIFAGDCRVDFGAAMREIGEVYEESSNYR